MAVVSNRILTAANLTSSMPPSFRHQAFMADLKLLLVRFRNYATHYHPGPVRDDPSCLNWPTFIVNAPSAQWGTPLHAACRRTPMRVQAALDSATLRDTD
jgi:hypothetical protein